MVSGRARLAVWLVLFGLALVGIPRALAAERRVALIVGASAYRTVPPLRNTLNDARGMAAALGRLGFDVDTVLDPDRSHFEAAIRRFGERTHTADVALFYYAGHAVEANGRNWLLPVSADIHSSRDLRFEAMDLDGILDQLEGGARLSVIILDSCRDNPLRMRLADAKGARGLGRAGLAQVQAAVGTLVVFSTAPGAVAADGTGPNSPFTGALLKRIETPGIEVRQMLADVRREVREATRSQQIPWEQSAMEGSLFLKPVGTGPEPGIQSTAPAQSPELLDEFNVLTSRPPGKLHLTPTDNGRFYGPHAGAETQ